MTRIWLLFAVSIIIFSSCVPAKKLVYLQKEDLKKRKEIPRDTVLRTHPLKYSGIPDTAPGLVKYYV